MTNKNNPKVIIVAGMVKKTNIGFTKTFNNPNTTATIKAVVKLLTEIPGKKCAITTTKTVVIKSLTSIFIIIFFLNITKKTPKLVSF